MESNIYTHTVKGQDVYIVPPEGKHTETVVFLHGLGDSATGGWLQVFTSKHSSPLLPSTKVVMLTAPIAPVTITFGMKMTSWYDIKGFPTSAQDFDKSICLKEVETSTERVRAVLKEEIEILKGDSKRVFLIGFSQGCALALHSGLGYEKTLGGIAGWSGFYFPVTKTTQQNENTPVLIANGLDDTTVPFMIADLSFKFLDADKHKVVRIKEPGCGHIINENIGKETAKWFKNLVEKQ